MNNWLAHLPFARDLVEAVQPKLVVELGTHYGESYFGLCQSVLEAELPCTCYAVDTWRGDPHSEMYGEAVFEEVAEYNKSQYGGFSYLLRKTFDEALISFRDGSIDLLHIDGFHTYDAVAHDFRNWLPKVRPGGVVLLHDIAVRDWDFGVWRLWDEISAEYGSFAFQHNWGLGVMVKPGAEPPAFVTDLVSASEDARSSIRGYYSECGERLRATVLSESSRIDITYQSAGAERKHTIGVRNGRAETLQIRLDALGTGSTRVHFGPKPCVVDVSDLTLRAGTAEWSMCQQGDGFEIEGDAMACAGRCGVGFVSLGPDAQLCLPSLAFPGIGTLRISVRVHPIADSLTDHARAWSSVYQNLSGTSEGIRYLGDCMSGRNRDDPFVEIERLRTELARTGKLAAELQIAVAGSASEVQDLRRSWSWRLTSPVRRVGSVLIAFRNALRGNSK